MMHKDLAVERAFAATQYEREREYWVDKLSGELEKTCFPPDIRTAGGRERTMAAFSFRFPRDIFERFTTISSGSDSRLHMLLVTGITLLLYKYTGHSDIIIGTPIDKQEAEGDFVNTILALRVRVEEGMTVRDLLMQVKQTVIEVHENQNYPLEIIPYQLNMPAADDGFPLFDAAVLLQNIQDKRYIQHLKLNLLFSFYNTGGSMEGEVEYNASMYGETTILGIIDHFFHLVQEAFSRVDLKLEDISLLSEQEREDILFGFNDTMAEYSRGKTVHQLFEEQVEKTPGNTAVIFDGKALTYEELNEGANKLAWELRKKGVKPDCFAAVIIDRSIEMVMGVMAILKAGGAYVPLEPYLPEARILASLSSLNVKYLLTDYARLSKVDRIGKGLPDLKYVFCLDDIHDYAGIGALLENKQLISPGELGESPTGNPAPSAAPTDIAYVIFTSGTTGTPKGVVEKHRPVINIIEWVNKTFNVSSSDKLLFVASLGFDLSVYDIFGILAAGASIRVVKSEDIKLPDRLLDIILEEGITFWDSAPAALQLLVPYLPELKNNRPGSGKNRLRLVFLSGDWIPVTMPDALKEVFEGVNVIGLGGATEATIWSNYYPIGKVDPDWNSIPYGKPIQNAKYYILDRWLAPCPIGVPGDIFIGGECLASGYINDETLTAKKFIDNPFVPGEKMYRTGDMARWFPDGNMEFLGRRDNQVKIRGFRIELGEIETQLLSHDEIKEAAASVKEVNGNKYLCAYYVADSKFKALDLSEYLAGTLPGYMIPSYFIRMDRMPLTPNGKLDRKGLPGPQFGIGEKEYAAPRDAVEKKLVKIWSGILEVQEEKISIDANFFELGGHSLRAAIMASNIHKELNVKLSVADVFENPTIKDLSEFLADAVQDIYASIRPVEVKEYYPLSSAQMRMFLLSRIKGAATSDNISMAFMVKGLLDLQQLEDTFRRLIERHELLRTSFEMVDHQPVQRLHESVEFKLNHIEADNRTGSIPEQQINGIIDDFIRPFDLGCPPLLRVGLLKISEHQHLLMYDMHHIISDGTSFQVFAWEFVHFYAGGKLAPLKIQYKDFTIWQNNQVQAGAFEKQEAYWLHVFSDEVPALNLPTDYPRQEIQGFAGDFIEFVLDNAVIDKISGIAAEIGGTLYMALLTVYNILLYKISGQEDIVVGTSSAGRPHADLQNVIGFFVNTLAMRNYPGEEKSFLQFLGEVKTNALEAYANQDYQFDELVKRLGIQRDPGRQPLFDTHFTLHNIHVEKINTGMEPDLEDVEFTYYPIEEKTTQFDIITHANYAWEGILFTMRYSTKLFKKETIRRFANHYTEIVRIVVENKDIKIRDIKISHTLEAAQANMPRADFNF